MKERHDADGNQGGPLLSVVEGQTRQGKRRRDLPSQYPTIVANGQDAAAQAPTRSLKLRRVNDKFVAELKQRAENYRLDALVELHRIAMTPLGDAAENRVKFMAASYLLGFSFGGQEVSAGGFDLSSLKEAYQNNALRIRQVREKTVTYVEDASPPAERVADVVGPTGA